MNPIVNKYSEQLSSENAALCKEGNVEKIRKRYHHDFTPSSATILSYVKASMEDLICAEEYSHPVLRKEDAVKNANEKLEMCLKALKESLIAEDKNRRGLWIATA
jgi:hypothetical protein